jgi:hypothetical protein
MHDDDDDDGDDKDVHSARTEPPPPDAYGDATVVREVPADILAAIEPDDQKLRSLTAQIPKAPRVAFSDLKLDAAGLPSVMFEDESDDPVERARAERAAAAGDAGDDDDDDDDDDGPAKSPLMAPVPVRAAAPRAAGRPAAAPAAPARSASTPPPTVRTAPAKVAVARAEPPRYWLVALIFAAAVVVWLLAVTK